MAGPDNASARPSAVRQILLLLGACGWLGFNIVFVKNRLLPSTTAKNEGSTVTFDEAAVGGDAAKGVNHHERRLTNINSLRMHGDSIGVYDDGTPFYTPKEAPPKDLDMARALRVGGGFNLFLSDHLPLDRNVTDTRATECKRIEYKQDELEAASVIIVFFNEPFSTLMRSVHSVLNRTPPDLLHEIILVDDGSDMNWIRKGGSGELEEYVKLLNRVAQTRLVRLPIRKGIVGARMAGIRAAEAKIFVILDSHVEVQPFWLEPLVKRIKENPSAVLMPQVDGIDPETFVPRGGGIGCTLGFLWKLIEHAFDPSSASPPDRQAAKDWEFKTSPTMAGGLFAANTDFFFEVGAYDEQFIFWGTENLELSFRLWMCGGILECAPCSRVYHIFRKGGVGYSSPHDAVTKNKMRLLTIWMDEFADLAWRTIGRPRVDFGNYDKDLQWREKRQCKTFKWFLENVNPEANVKAVPDDVPFLGNLKNEAAGKCMDTTGSDYPGHGVGLHHCHPGNTQQFMHFRRPGWILPVTNDETCLGEGKEAKATGWCNFQRWEVDMSTGQLKNVQNGKCLGVKASDDSTLTYLKCDPHNPMQKWTWEAYNPPKLFTPPPPPKLRGQVMAEDE